MESKKLSLKCLAYLSVKQGSFNPLCNPYPNLPINQKKTYRGLSIIISHVKTLPLRTLMLLKRRIGRNRFLIFWLHKLTGKSFGSQIKRHLMDDVSSAITQRNLLEDSSCTMVPRETLHIEEKPLVIIDYHIVNLKEDHLNY